MMRTTTATDPRHDQPRARRRWHRPPRAFWAGVFTLVAIEDIVYAVARDGWWDAVFLAPAAVLVLIFWTLTHVYDAPTTHILDAGTLQLDDWDDQRVVTWPGADGEYTQLYVGHHDPADGAYTFDVVVRRADGDLDVLCANLTPQALTGVRWALDVLDGGGR